MPAGAISRTNVMKKIFPALILFLSCGLPATWAKTEDCRVAQSDIYNGYIVRTFPISNAQSPMVVIEDEVFTNVATGTNATIAPRIEVSVGVDRKQPIVVVRIPAYVKDAEGNVKMRTSFRLHIIEDDKNTTQHAAKPTGGDVGESVLNTGTWYRIGITRTGFFKITSAFISSMGVDPSKVNPANIRIYGNGGRMLPEQNFLPRPTDLVENAIEVRDDGNGIMNEGDHVIFYGLGPMGWDADSANDKFVHLKNLYTDTAYYFVTFDKGAGKRVGTQNATGAGNVTVTEYNYYDVWEKDLVNPAGYGKKWYGESFNPLAGNLTQNFSFSFGTQASQVKVKLAVALQGAAGSSFNMLVNGSPTGVLPFLAGVSDNVAVVHRAGEWLAPAPASGAAISLTFSPNAGAIGFLDYLEVNARCQLAITSDQLSFRDIRSYGAGKVATYQLQGANGNTRVWDVTDPYNAVRLVGTASGSTYTFTQDATMLREFAATNTDNLYTPTYSGMVGNQNLHGLGPVDNIIVSHPLFVPYAEELANYHRTQNNMRVIVVTPQSIYNEFSSGAQDISAIRDFVKMFYDRAGTDVTQMPHYLTLFGGASYDYKDRLPNNSNFVPVFESAESSLSLAAVMTDDFYGFLDDNEYIEDPLKLNVLDIGIGRLPARNVQDAANLVAKIKSYKTPATLGAWRLVSTIVADDADGAGDHMQDGEQMAAHITATTRNLYNHGKIYIDAIPVISTPAGPRCPNGSAALSDRVYKGTMLINYSGHGNTQVWAEERLLTPDDFNKWNNAHMLPFMVTATCDYGQYDRPQYVSAGEQQVLRKGGGVISMLTTTAAVYASYNNPLNALYLKTQLAQKSNGKWHSFGDATRIGKNATYATSVNANELANYRKFALLGDPALTPNFPEYFVAVDSITDIALNEPADTIKALGAYRVTGHLHNADGVLLSDFNGILSASIFDKPRTISTITGANKTFRLQDNLVYKGKVSVTGGKYTYTFIAPKDINYNYGTGKISSYAHNGITDGAGADTSVTIGGFSDNPVYSDAAPIVKPYISDSMFQNGGVTGTNTSLYVVLYSETGINVSGNKLGHDLTAVLDGNVEQPYILNDYYETAPNTYQRGYVNFPINGLPNGRHTIKVKAWDVNNNSGEGTVDFEVIDGKIVAIENLGNYPNPFSNFTRFVFEHNHPDEELDVKINIYNTAGAKVKGLQQLFTPTGSRTAEITWDATADNGESLPSGMYMYRIMITTSKGYHSSAYQKMVIVR